MAGDDQLLSLDVEMTEDQERVLEAMENERPIVVVPSRQPRACEYRWRSARSG